MSMQPIPATPAEWHALRLRNVGGSESAALMLPHDQLPPYMQSVFALHHVKAGRIPAPDVGNERTRWGQQLEQVIADAAAEQEEWTIRPGAYASDDTTPGMGCTLDRIIESGPRDWAEGYEGPGALECKNVDWLVHKRSWGDEPPPHILIQHQHQLACTGYAWGAVAALVGGHTLKVHRYRAKPKIIAEIRKRVARFWEQVRAGQEPKVDGTDATAAALRALYPAEEEPLDLRDDAELAILCAELTDATARRREVEAEEAELRNRVMQRVAGHRRVMVQGFNVSLAVTPAKPDREARAGEIIRGRGETRRLTVTERTS